jgi:hypothetical protein
MATKASNALAEIIRLCQSHTKVEIPLADLQAARLGTANVRDAFPAMNWSYCPIRRMLVGEAPAPKPAPCQNCKADIKPGEGRYLQVPKFKHALGPLCSQCYWEKVPVLKAEPPLKASAEKTINLQQGAFDCFTSKYVPPGYIYGMNAKDIDSYEMGFAGGGPFTTPEPTRQFLIGWRYQDFFRQAEQQRQEMEQALGLANQYPPKKQTEAEKFLAEGKQPTPGKRRGNSFLIGTRPYKSRRQTMLKTTKKLTFWTLVAFTLMCAGAACNEGTRAYLNAPPGTPTETKIGLFLKHAATMWDIIDDETEDGAVYVDGGTEG